MKNPGFMLQALPIFIIILAGVLFLIFKMVSRFKPDAVSQRDLGAADNFLNQDPGGENSGIRIKLNSPAMIVTEEDDIETEVKEISLGGAFVTCLKPLPVGKKLEIRMKDVDHKTLILKSEVIWNNTNVPDENIVNRGMRVRFVQLGEKNRQALEKIITQN
jgi:hypothetical protein